MNQVHKCSHPGAWTDVPAQRVMTNVMLVRPACLARAIPIAARTPQRSSSHRVLRQSLRVGAQQQKPPHQSYRRPQALARAPPPTPPTRTTPSVTSPPYPTLPRPHQPRAARSSSSADRLDRPLDLLVPPRNPQSTLLLFRRRRAAALRP